MTIKEAIHKMEFMKLGYERLRDQSVTSGAVLGEGIKGYWAADTPMSELYQAHVDACEMSIEALKKWEAGITALV
jgi:hypothetical protein